MVDVKQEDSTWSPYSSAPPPPLQQDTSTASANVSVQRENDFDEFQVVHRDREEDPRVAFDVTPQHSGHSTGNAGKVELVGEKETTTNESSDSGSKAQGKTTISYIGSTRIVTTESL